jgi:hypothetical protein
MDFIRMAFFTSDLPERSLASQIALGIAKLKSNPSKTDKNRQKNAKKKEKHRTQIVIIKQIIHIHNVRKR